MTSEMELLTFWGKTADGDAYHPLLYHLVDVACVAHTLLTDALPAPVCAVLAQTLGLSDVQMPSVTAYLAGLHDLGKAIPGFQYQQPTLAARLPSLAPQGPVLNTLPHGIATAHQVQALLAQGRLPVHTPASDADLLGRLLGGHHGLFPTARDLVDLGRRALGDTRWTEAREGLAATLAILLGIEARTSLTLAANPALVPLIAGLVTIADWIGSSSDFPPAHQCPLDAYSVQAMAQAQTALQRTGWLPPLQPASPAPFHALFPFAPNALQRTLADVVDAQQTSYLLIVEAPMGVGKTEAALYAADANLTHGLTGGCFVGLPTQATTNAMYRRVRAYLERRGHSGREHLQLIHGHAALMLDDEPTSASDPLQTEAASWFRGRKRALLAPFGVGTIDQALMSVLQTRHWFVRLFGLAGKTVILDEVHAYDTYMSTILDRLLAWLGALGCSVVLLSATLPTARRRALIAAYSGDTPSDDTTAYPRLTLARRTPTPQVETVPVPPELSAATSVTLVTHSTALDALATTLQQALIDGGCAVVICNTVNRAQHTYQALAARLPDTECLLFHARMPFGMRERVETQVLERFGTDGQRPIRAVLVATQVVEQSLDLDFDWMASEMAPVDLLLQRIGRLHRHRAHDGQRPSRVQTPALHLLCDVPMNDTPPDFGASEAIYARYVLLRTWQTLHGRTQIFLPQDIDPLIAAVYDEKTSPAHSAAWQAALADSSAALLTEQEEANRNAERVVIPAPQPPKFLLQAFNADLADDEDPAIHPTLRAATRDGRPSIQVVCLCATPEGWQPWGCDLRLTPETVPTHTQTQALLRAAVPVSTPGLYQALQVLAPPPGWRHHPHLRYTRAVVFAHNTTEVGPYVLTLDETLGLLITRKETVHGRDI